MASREQPVPRESLQVRRLSLAWLGWLAMTATLIAAWAPGLIAYVDDLAHPPASAQAGLDAAYVSAGAHAGYHAGLDLLFAAISIGAGAMLLARAQRSPLAASAAFAVTGWGIGSGLVVESFPYGADWRWALTLPGWTAWLLLLRTTLNMRGQPLTLRDRQRLKWTWYGMGASLFAVLLVVATVGSGAWLAADEIDRRMTGHLLTVFGALLFPYALFTAWLRPDTPDPDTLIRRTLVYGGLSAIIVVATIGFVLLPALLYAELAPIYALTMIIVWAIAGLHLQRYLQQAVNRLLYGQRDEPMEVLNALGSRLELGEPERTLSALVETISAALKLPAVRIEVAGTGEVMASTGDPGDLHQTRLPIWHERLQVGELIVAQRARDEALDDRDREVLHFLARQAGPTVRAVQLNQELRRSRREILVSREEERRRIRRDLHDGLGPALAAIAMQSDTARAVIDDDPEAVRAMLDAITSQAEEIVQEVRRLVYALRPPALDELGLAGALERLARQGATPSLSIDVAVDSDLPSLDAAVEMAIYRVAAEALTNAARHADARHCEIRLTRESAGDSATLCLTIDDDGVGIAENATPGIGLRSMRDRVGEVGGRLDVGRREPHGTRVAATIPLDTLPPANDVPPEEAWP